MRTVKIVISYEGPQDQGKVGGVGEKRYEGTTERG